MTGTDVVQRMVDSLGPVSLAEVLDVAELQQRVDRKYVVTAARLAAALGDGDDPLARVDAPLRALEIDGRRLFGYRTVYFDSPDLICFRHHVQRRRRRAKVRTRTYLDSRETLLEVKVSDGPRTLKHRTPWSATDQHRLGTRGRAFVAEHAPYLSAGAMRPSVITDYRRATLLCPEDRSRVTLDVELVATGHQRTHAAPSPMVIVETKSSGPRGPVDRALARAGIRPTSVSKYCVAIALTRPSATSNPWRWLLRRHFGWTAPGRGLEGCAA